MIDESKDPDEAAPAENSAQAYIIHVPDQDNRPVEEVTANGCCGCGKTENCRYVAG